MDYKEAIARNRQPRINWIPILGTSLSMFVAERVSKGRRKFEIIGEIGLAYQDYLMRKLNAPLDSPYIVSQEIQSRIEIGVSARMGEMESEKKAYFSTHGAKAIIWLVVKKDLAFLDPLNPMGLLGFGKRDDALRAVKDGEEVRRAVIE